MARFFVFKTSFDPKADAFFRQPFVNFILQAVIVLILTRFLCYIGWLVYNLTNRPDPPYWDFKK